MMFAPRLKTARRALLLASVTAATTLLTSHAHADKNWNTAIFSGNWNLNTNWLENLIPSNTDNVTIAFADSASHTVTYIGSISSELTLDLRNTGTGAATLLLPGTFNMTLGNELIGATGQGQINQLGGINTVDIALTLGSAATASGVYTLSGGTLSHLMGNTILIGEKGYGSFAQSGGYVESQVGLTLGSKSGSIGNYSVSGSGSLFVVGAEIIGAAGTGNFLQTGGGAHYVSGPITLGQTLGALGIYTLGGTASLTSNQSITIGLSGTGSFVQSGGTNRIIGGLSLGASSNGAGFYTLSAGTLTATGGVSLGSVNNSQGNINQTGGSFTIGTLPDSNGSLGVGYGSYTLSATGTLLVYGHESIGGTGPGVFTQSGGSHTMTGGLVVGFGGSNVGSYYLSAGSLNAAYEDISLDGYGSFVHTGGNNTVNNYLQIGASDNPQSGSGNYSQSGSSLLTINGDEYVNTGSHDHSGGTNSITGSLFLGSVAGHTGVYNLSGSARLIVQTAAYIGGTASSGSTPRGTGILNIQTASLNLPGLLQIWNDTGSVNVTNGTLSAANLQSLGSLTAQTSALSAGSFNNTGKISLLNSTFNAPQGTNQAAGTLDATGTTLTFGTGANRLANSGRINLTDSKVVGDITSALGSTLNAAGIVTFTGAINLAGPAILATVINTGSFSQTGPLTASANFTNSGTAILSGAQAWSPGTTFTNTGTATFNSDAGTPGNFNLNLRISHGTLTANSPQHLATLVIDPTLASSFAGTVDLKNNYLILGSGNSSNTLRTYLLAGSTNGTGLKSTTLAPAQGIGYIDATLYDLFHPDQQFQGQTVGGNELLAKLTWQGDADLSGFITMNDYAQLEAGFLFGHFNGTTTFASWVNGDFNYDGKINYQDYALIDAAFAAQSGTLANDMIQQHFSEFGAQYAAALHNLTPVPEPTTLSLLALALPTLLRRRPANRNS